MLALRKTAARSGLSLVDAPKPGPLGPTDVLIEVAAVGICGSDLHVDDWSQGYEFMERLLPLTLGHEFSGRVAAIGGQVTSVAVGERVVAWPSAPCNICAPCKSGATQNCADKRTIGLQRDGAFASHVVAREGGVFALPDGIDYEIAALVEPLCVGARAVVLGGVSQGQRVVVFGPGTIGLAAAMFARLSGAVEVAIVGFDDAPRLAVAEALGFSKVFDLAHERAAESLRALFSQADVVFEATGHPSTVGEGLGLLRNEGALVLTGIHAQPATVDLLAIVRRKLKLLGSHGSRREDWARVIATLERYSEAFRPMITHRLPLARALEGFSLAHSRTASKIIIHPQEGDAQ